MKSMRSFSAVKTLFLALFMAGLFPGLAHAQETAAGKFTLSFETRWGNTILPAGDYSLTMPSTTLWGFVMVRREPQGDPVAFVRADTWEEASSADPSKLILERRGEELIVRALYLRDKGYVFNFTVREAKAKTLHREPKEIQVTRASTTTR